MKPHVREFLEQEETRAALSKQAKAAKRKKRMARFAAWLEEKAERIEASGNPAAAATFRAFWTRAANGRYAKALNGIPERNP